MVNSVVFCFATSITIVLGYNYAWFYHSNNNILQAMLFMGYYKIACCSLRSDTRASFLYWNNCIWSVAFDQPQHLSGRDIRAHKLYAVSLNKVARQGFIKEIILHKPNRNHMNSISCDFSILSYQGDMNNDSWKYYQTKCIFIASYDKNVIYC